MPTSPLENPSWLQCYLETGMPGHLATLVFLGALAFAAVIYCKRLGLHYRLALLPLATIPLMSGIMGSCYDCAVPKRPITPTAPTHPSLIYGTLDERPLQVVAMSSTQTGILLLICFALLLHRDAGWSWGLEQE